MAACVPDPVLILNYMRTSSTQSKKQKNYTFCDEEAPCADPVAALRADLGEAPADGTELAVVIGPEGGFDEAERATLLRRPKTSRIALGPRILRADTAAVAALAVVQAAIGDWR